VNTHHYFIVIFFEEELNSPLKGNVGKKSRKKRPNVFRTTITNLFVTKDPFKKDV
jgi:hypothetical protein